MDQDNEASRRQDLPGDRHRPDEVGSSATAADTQEPTSGQRLWKGVQEILWIVGITLVISFLIKTFLFRAFFIPSGSMEETLQVDDRIFVNLLIPEPFGLDRGDVVVFQDTKGWLAEPAPRPANPVRDALEFVGLMPDSSQQHLVKRVIGMPGDHVAAAGDGTAITVNGVPVDEPYLHPGATPSDIPFDVVVPEGKVWVMGDHRNASADSRIHQHGPGEGFIDLDDVTGRAEVIAWPITRWGGAGGDREAFEQVPEPRAVEPGQQ
ncbi:signal peptidase I [Micrococcus terreus]|uniref:signal peptidase I n=1 Tax=Micrococcus terreus TaxID=574650 RepID=UPI0021A2A99D|nr:signal peptidase I [Micrococcus terreus]MCT2090134.1 signal peptidase I [Micrococcus terreus]